MKLNAVGQAGEIVIIRRADQDHVSVQAGGDVLVDARRVGGLTGRHHALHHDHIGISGGFAVAADNILHDLIQLAVTQASFHVRQIQRGGRGQTHGAADQRSGALRPAVTGVRLGDGLQKVDAQATALQGTNHAQADRCQADTKPGRGKKEGMH